MCCSDGTNDARRYFDEKSIVFTEDSTSYVDISGYVELQISEKSSERLSTKRSDGHISQSGMQNETE